ncbi:T9SS type A sorting domain-containing protein [bacterium]|nr:T9SS type A sorting domain-containing protein [bacterium]
MKSSLYVTLSALLLSVSLSLAQTDQYINRIGAWNPELGYLQIPDEYGSLADSTWQWHVIIDQAEDGLDLPSLVEGSIGFPTDDDSLLISGNLGSNQYKPQDELTVATIATFKADLLNKPVYLRVFNSGDLGIGSSFLVSYGNYTRLGDVFLAPKIIPVPSSGCGGFMEFTLDSTLYSMEVNEANFSPLVEEAILMIGNEFTALFNGNPHQGVEWVRLVSFQGVPDSWSYDVDCYPQDWSVSQFTPLLPENDFTQGVELQLESQLLSSHFGPETIPENLALYRETINGWEEQNTQISDLNDSWVFRFEISNELLSGKFTLAPSELSSATKEVSLTREYRFYPVYPNPFNPTTHIRFSLPEKTGINLQVFNVLGEEVASLYTGSLNEGAHSFTFSAGELPSGVYFVKLSSEQRVDIQKITLLR